MSTAVKIGIVVLVVAGVTTGLVLASRGDHSKKNGVTLVAVERGTITDKALATGQIVPEQEIQVKSQISGIVREFFVEVGDRVEAGQPLFTISPDPTPLELNEVERRVQLAEVAFSKAKLDLERNQSLAREGIVAQESLDRSQQVFDESRIQLELAKERLALTRDGRIRREVGGVDSVIRSPARGTILRRHVNPGDPVVPLTSYQAGTPLVTIADMGTLLFKGTVDEIDVGKLQEGMPVRIKIGALPEAVVLGRLTRIAPKATEREGTTLFDVEAVIDEATGIVLRAGYSANADIIIQEKQNTLVVPERLVHFDGDAPWVEVPATEPGGEPVRRDIRAGLSDGLRLEVLEGLGEGEQVVQRPPREIQ